MTQNHCYYVQHAQRFKENHKKKIENTRKDSEDTPRNKMSNT